MPADVILRMVWLSASATYRVPLAFTATPGMVEPSRRARPIGTALSTDRASQGGHLADGRIFFVCQVQDPVNSRGNAHGLAKTSRSP